MPIQDEKHEVVLFLCSHKDITKQKLHEQQQKVAAAAAALQHQQQQLAAQQAVGLTNDQSERHESDQQRQLQANHLAAADSRPLQLVASEAGNEKQSATELDNGKTQHNLALSSLEQATANQQQLQLEALQRQEHDDQQALISMEEFCIDQLGDDDDQLEEQDNDEHGDKNTASLYSRRRSRAVLYQLSGHYGYRRSVNMKSKLKLNNVSI